MTRIIGSMRRIDQNRGAVRVEDVYDTDVEDLWTALTAPDRLGRWIAHVKATFATQRWKEPDSS
ncbi:MAG: hypothetical protein JWM76_2941 [Pseudonocardiales bacterium]|nr:hypothetical protein [Pseudonocardiales bacterium]